MSSAMVPAPDDSFSESVRLFCLEAVPGPGAEFDFPDEPAWDPLREAGTELWLDTGDLDEAGALWCRSFSALTTNNTLLNREVQKGIYDELVPDADALVRREAPDLPEERRILEIAFILNAVHGLKLTRRFGADVSVELHTDLAHDVEASVAYGLRYHAIEPKHFIVKVPLTAAGLCAARRLSEAGVQVNFTLGFSARQNVLIAAFAKPAYCNVFMGRINAFVKEGGLGDGRGAGEKATAASQAAVAALRARNLCGTKQIGASMRGPSQVVDLAGIDVYTMPPRVARGYLEQGLAEKVRPGRLNEPFEVAFEGVDPQALGLEVFWRRDPSEEEALITAARAGAGDPGELRAALAQAGVGDILPELSASERAALAEGGKIPSFARFRTAAAERRAGWDALLTEAGLASFAADQAALDERIRSLIRT